MVGREVTLGKAGNEDWGVERLKDEGRRLKVLRLIVIVIVILILIELRKASRKDRKDR